MVRVADHVATHRAAHVTDADKSHLHVVSPSHEPARPAPTGVWPKLAAVSGGGRTRSLVRQRRKRPSVDSNTWSTRGDAAPLRRHPSQRKAAGDAHLSDAVLLQTVRARD